MHFYHTNNDFSTIRDNIGIAWLQVDFKFMWNIESVRLTTRDPGDQDNIWQRISDIEVKARSWIRNFLLQARTGYKDKNHLVRTDLHTFTYISDQSIYRDNPHYIANKR